MQQVLIGLGQLAVHIEHLGNLIGGRCRAGELLVQHLEIRKQLLRWRTRGLAAIGFRARCRGRSLGCQHIPQSRIGVRRIHGGGKNGCRCIAFGGGSEAGRICSHVRAQIGRFGDGFCRLHQNVAFIGKCAGCFHRVAQGLGGLDP